MKNMFITSKSGLVEFVHMQKYNVATLPAPSCPNVNYQNSFAA